MIVPKKVKDRLDELLQNSLNPQIANSNIYNGMKLKILKNLRDMYNAGYEDGQQNNDKEEIEIIY